MEFAARLKAVGIDADTLGTGVTEKEVVIRTVADFKAFVDIVGDEEYRRAVFEALFDGTPDGDDPTLRAIEEYVFGLSDLDPEIAMQVEDMFPIWTYISAAAAPLTVTGAYDLSTPGGEMRRAIFSDVVVEDGGYLVCSATPLEFYCKTFTCKGKPPEGMGVFNILGRPGADLLKPVKLTAPDQPLAGKSANCGTGAPGETGTGGTDGGDGANGAQGNRGLASQVARIQIRQSLTMPAGQQLVIATSSGAGGKGQDGGDGQDGGKGGVGGAGTQCGCGGINAGNGGLGGRGGRGGNGGAGGNAVDAAADIVIEVPVADLPKVASEALTTIAQPGAGGGRGAGGNGGVGGAGGASAKGAGAGTTGVTKGPGGVGDMGAASTVTGKPAKAQPLGI